MSITEQEINCQRQALNDLSHGDDSLVIKYVDWNDYAIPEAFRFFILKSKSMPTASELINEASKMLDFNIRTLY
ncbi:MAG: hypothetical protein GY756_13215 [bacterium]|nr:hypothetical protein [bacterium]